MSYGETPIRRGSQRMDETRRSGGGARSHRPGRDAVCQPLPSAQPPAGLGRVGVAPAGRRDHRPIEALADRGRWRRTGCGPRVSPARLLARVHRPRADGCAVSGRIPTACLARGYARRHHRDRLCGGRPVESGRPFTGGAAAWNLGRSCLAGSRSGRVRPARVCPAETRGRDRAPGHRGAAPHRPRAARCRFAQHLDHQCPGGRRRACHGRAPRASPRGLARDPGYQQGHLAGITRDPPGAASGR